MYCIYSLNGITSNCCTRTEARNWCMEGMKHGCTEACIYRYNLKTGKIGACIERMTYDANTNEIVTDRI